MRRIVLACAALGLLALSACSSASSTTPEVKSGEPGKNRVPKDPNAGKKPG